MGEHVRVDSLHHSITHSLIEAAEQFNDVHRVVWTYSSPHTASLMTTPCFITRYTLVLPCTRKQGGSSLNDSGAFYRIRLSL